MPELETLVQGVLLKPVGRSELHAELARHLAVRTRAHVEAERAAHVPVESFVDIFRREARAAGLLAEGGGGDGPAAPGLASGWAIQVRPSLAEASKTFSLLAAERTARALVAIGASSGIASLCALGEQLAGSAAIVDINALKNALAEARKIGEIIEAGVVGAKGRGVASRGGAERAAESG